MHPFENERINRLKEEKDYDMPTPLDLPYPPLICIQSDEPVTWERLFELVGERLREGVSICIQSERGVEKRGGFFFHVKHTDEGYSFCTFDRTEVVLLSNETECMTFINHVSGRMYDEEMWRLCNSQVNFRSDNT